MEIRRAVVVTSVAVQVRREAELLDAVRAAFCVRSRVLSIFFGNLHSLAIASRSASYTECFNRATVVVNDGVGLSLLARLRYTRFPANLNGTDLIPKIVECAAESRSSVFLYGARDGVAERVAASLQARHSQLVVAGWCSGFSGLSDSEIADRVRLSGASLLIVCLGNPQQEFWVDSWAPQCGVAVAVAGGAYFDFEAGVVVRAPLLLRRLRLEWLYRLLQEPGRLVYRYLVEAPLYMCRSMLFLREDIQRMRHGL